MTQEEKQQLLKDLSARLPHYTMVLMGDGGVELLVSVNVDTGRGREKILVGRTWF